MASNQPPSSNETPWTKQNTQLPGVQNKGGSESSETTLIPGTGESAPIKAQTDLNGSASSENCSAQYKYPSVSEDAPSEGRGQYE